MIWARFIGLSALAMLVACSNDGKDVAAGSFETENSIAIQVTNANGTVAAKAKVIIHEADYLSEIHKASTVQSGDTPSGDVIVSVDIATNYTKTPETDTDGMLYLDSLPTGQYMVEVISAKDSEQKGANAFEVPAEVPDSTMIVPVQLGNSISVSGNVQTDKENTWVMIRGMQYATKVNSDGSFSFPSIPASEFEIVLVYPTENAKGTLDNVIIGSTTLRTGQDQKTMTLVDTTMKSSGKEVQPDTTTTPKDTAKVDTVKKDTVPEDTLVHFMFEDFEDVLDDEGKIKNWYTSHSDDATAELEIVNTDSERSGYVAHFQCTNDADYNWALMGQYLEGGPFDMSAIDSVVFWARGTVKNYISFSFDIIQRDEEANTTTSAKSWTHITLTEDWKRYSFTPAAMQPADDDNGGNVGWDAVKGGVTNISIFGGAGGEFWIDDIEIFGLDKFTPKSE